MKPMAGDFNYFQTAASGISYSTTTTSSNWGQQVQVYHPQVYPPYVSESMKLKSAGAAVVEVETGVIAGTYEDVDEALRSARRLAAKNGTEYFVVRPIKRVGPKPTELDEADL
jgi:hypothetical protein